MWLKHVKTIINHPPVITICIGGMVTIPTWVVYCLVLTCFNRTTPKLTNLPGLRLK